MERQKAKIYLFKPRGKYYTEEEWIIPTEAEARAHPDLVHPGDVVSPVIMRYSPDFRRIDGGPVLVLEQEPWGYPHLFPGVTEMEQFKQQMTRDIDALGGVAAVRRNISDTRRLIATHNSPAATRKELDRLFAEAKRSARYPEHVDGMELGHRLFDFNPDSWSVTDEITVSDLKRGEIVRVPSSGITDPAIITSVELAEKGRIRLRMTNLTMAHTHHVIERRPDSTDFTLRLDLLYLEANMDAGETALRGMAAEMRTRFEPEDVQPDTWQAGWMAAIDYMDPDVDSVTSTRWE